MVPLNLEEGECSQRQRCPMPDARFRGIVFFCSLRPSASFPFLCLASEESQKLSRRLHKSSLFDSPPFFAIPPTFGIPRGSVTYRRHRAPQLELPRPILTEYIFLPVLSAHPYGDSCSFAEARLGPLDQHVCPSVVAKTSVDAFESAWLTETYLRLWSEVPILNLQTSRCRTVVRFFERWGRGVSESKRKTRAV